MTLPAMKPWEIALAVAGGVAGVWLLADFVRGRSQGAFGRELVKQAALDLGITETTDPERVGQILSTYGLPSSSDWCAAAVGTWVRQAAGALGVAPPIAGSPGAKATMAQFQALGQWLTPAQIASDPTLVSPGMVPVWQRGAPGSWTGHIGVVSSAAGTSFTSIEGNAGPVGGAVVESLHDVGSAALLGMGFF